MKGTDAPLSGLPVPWKEQALPWDAIIYFHGAPAKDLTRLHGVIEGHTLACANAWRKGESPGCSWGCRGDPQAPSLGLPMDEGPKSRSLRQKCGWV